MEENQEIKNLNNHLKPILDKKIKRGNLILFVNNYLDCIESTPRFMSIINGGKKEHQKKIDKMSELEAKIQDDIDEFYEILIKILKEKNLFNINNPKYKEILTIKEINDVYLREPPYNLPDIEAYMLSSLLIKKEDWVNKYWNLKSAVSSLIENKKDDILQELLSIQKASDPEKLVSEFYKPYHILWQRQNDDLGAIWNDLEKERSYFPYYYGTKRLRECVEALHHLIKIEYQNPLDIEPEASPKPLPSDVKPPKITEDGHFILEFEDGKILDFESVKDLSTKYFRLTLKRLGQLTPYSLACNELELENNQKSKRKIRGFVKTLGIKFFNNNLSNRIIYSTNKRNGYILNITDKVDN